MEITGIRNLSFSKNVSIEEVASKFEAIFISHVLKGFQATIPKSGLFEESFGNVLESIIGMQFSDELCKAYNFGLRNLILNAQDVITRNEESPFPKQQLVKEAYKLCR